MCGVWESEIRFFVNATEPNVLKQLYCQGGVRAFPLDTGEETARTLSDISDVDKQTKNNDRTGITNGEREDEPPDSREFEKRGRFF